MIRKGDILSFKPEWRDKGDEKFTFVARTDEENGLFDVSVLEQRHYRIWPTEIVRANMVEKVLGRIEP